MVVRAAISGVTGLQNQPSAQVIDGSLIFDNTKSNHLSRTPGTSSNLKTWTWSSWIKRTKFGATGRILRINPSGESGIQFGSDDRLEVYHYADSSYTVRVTPTQVLRDTGWYHIVVAFDSTQSTSSDRLKVYINGTQSTIFTYSTYPSENFESYFNLNSAHSIFGSDLFPAGYVSQVYWIDGQALGPENFGFTDLLTNTWKPKKPKITGPNGGQVWSSNVTLNSGNRGGGSGDAAMFDGILPTAYGVGGNFGGIAVTPSETSSSMTIDLGQTFTNVKVTIYPYFAASAATCKVDFGGGDIVTLTGSELYFGAYELGTHTFSSMTLTQVFVTGGGSNFGIGGIAIDGVMLINSTTNNFGPNGFYLPLDGNSPTGEDKSGKGNDWSPVNFGGSVALDNPNVSGGRPILNTSQGGAVAVPGVFGSLENKYYTVTTANGSVYQFDITSGDNPSLEFIRGATYTFDYTSHSSHPLAFSSTDPDSSTTSYTDGVNTAVSNVTKITVPNDAPDTLYYYCTAHASAMNGSISITTDETKADSFASNLKLAVDHSGTGVDRTNSLNNNTNLMTSFSLNNATYSSRYASKGAPYKTALYLSGTSNYPNIDFTSGSFNFLHNQDDSGTVEFWWYNGSFSTEGYLLSTMSGSPDVGFSINASGSTGVIVYIARGVSGSTKSTSVANLPQNKWSHIAVTKQKVGSNVELKLYVDGVLGGSNTSITATDLSNSNSSYSYFRTGSPIGHESSRGWTNAAMSDLRIYNTVKYTDDFVVPSTQPDIVPDTPTGVVGNSKLTKNTEGSVSFDGTAATKLRVPDSTDFTFGSNDWTIEFWYYNNSNDGSYNVFLDMLGSSRSGIQLAIATDGNYRIEIGDGANNWIWQLTDKPSKVGKWTHFALSRESNKIRFFEDGIFVARQTSSTAVGDPTNVAIGGYTQDDSSNYGFNGYISNFRIVNGTAVYTAEADQLGGPVFTPSRTKLTNVTNTKLLGCQSDTQPGTALASPNMGGVNDGTQWSHYVTGDIDDSFPAWRAFRNRTDLVGVRTKTAGGATIVWAPPKPIAFSSTFKIWAARDGASGGTFTVTHAGGTTDFTSSVVTSTTQTAVDLASVSGVTSPISKITVVSGGPNPRFSGIEVDSVMLVDPLSPQTAASATPFSPFVYDIDKVRGEVTGYPTFNPLNNTTNTLTEGNLFVTGGSGWNTTLCTGEMTSGKWFIELIHRGRQSASDNDIQFGLFGLNDTEDGYPLPGSKDIAAQETGYCIVDANAQFYNNSSSTGYGSTWDSPGDVVGMRFNADTGKLGFIINGVDQGDVVTTLAGGGGGYGNQRWVAAVSLRGGNAKAEINFGQRPFKFPPPDGFLPLNNANLRSSDAIYNPDQYVGVTTYVGNGSVNSVKGLNFGDKPDFVWIKQITETAQNHALFDSIRGPGHNLSSSTNHAERSDHSGSTGDLMSFDVNGFTLGSSAASGARPVNLNGEDIVAWCWKAGGSKGTFNVDGEGFSSAAAAGLTGGTITPSAATVGTKNGFSIVKFTGPGSAGFQSVPHGLGKKPNMIFCKDLDNDRNWGVYQSDVIAGSDNIAFILNSTSNGFTSDTATWDVSEINETIFTPYFRDDFGASYGADNIAYIWCDIPGVQKFGTYDGNSSADGAMVECGFRPALVMCKAYNGSQPWQVYDNQRGKTNVIQNGLQWNSSNSQYTGTDRIDFLSNGFKLKGSGGVEPNVDGLLYVYAAWAEAPAIDLFGGGGDAH